MRVHQDPVTGSYWREDGQPGYACPDGCGNGYATAEAAQPDAHGCNGPDPDNGCPHPRTQPGDRDPDDRVCAACGTDLDLTPTTAAVLRLRDDPVYVIRSLDGTVTYDGPYLSWWQANLAAEALEDSTGQPTDITITLLSREQVSALAGRHGTGLLAHLSRAA